MLTKISCKELLKILKPQVKNRKRGEAFYHIERLIHVCDMEWSAAKIAENLACDIGYDIRFWGPYNTDNDEDFLEESEIEELTILLYQKASEENPEAFLDSNVEYITDNYDIIYDALSESESIYEILLNSFKEIRTFERKYNKIENAKTIDEIIEKFEKAPVRQLIAIKNVMPIGKIVDSYMITLNNEFEAYDYAAEINCSTPNLKPDHIRIETLFKCNKDSDIVKIDFKAIRPQYVSESCISYGKFIGNFNESIEVDINNENQMKTDICNALNKCMVKLRNFLKTHKEENSYIRLTEVPVNYGTIG